MEFFPSNEIFLQLFGVMNITYYSLSYIFGTIAACYFGYKIVKKKWLWFR